MNTPRTTLRSWIWIVLCVLLPSPAAWGQSSRPAPMSLPAGITAAPNRAFMDTPMPKPVAEALKDLTEEELTVLGDTSTTSSNPPTSDPGVPILLKHISAVKRFNKDQFAQLEPGIVRLLRKYGPEDFYLCPVQMDVEVRAATRFMPVRSKYWPADQPAWQLDCISRSSPGGEDDSNPNIVSVIVAEDLSADLGKPDVKEKVGGIERWIYKKYPRRMQIAGVFYRNYVSLDRNKNEATYPLIIAWQNLRTESASGGGITNQQLFYAGGAILIVFVLWFMLRTIAKRRMQAEQDRRRTAEAEEFVPTEQDIAQMDPELLAAAEAYFQEHPEKRPISHSKPVKKTIGDSGEEIIEVDPALRAAAEQFNKDHGSGKHSS